MRIKDNGQVTEIDSTIKDIAGTAGGGGGGGKKGKWGWKKGR